MNRLSAVEEVLDSQEPHLSITFRTMHDTAKGDEEERELNDENSARVHAQSDGFDWESGLRLHFRNPLDLGRTIQQWGHALRVAAGLIEVSEAIPAQVHEHEAAALEAATKTSTLGPGPGLAPPTSASAPSTSPTPVVPGQSQPPAPVSAPSSVRAKPLETPSPPVRPSATPPTSSPLSPPPLLSPADGMELPSESSESGFESDSDNVSLSGKSITSSSDEGSLVHDEIFETLSRAKKLRDSARKVKDGSRCHHHHHKLRHEAEQQNKHGAEAEVGAAAVPIPVSMTVGPVSTNSNTTSPMMGVKVSPARVVADVDRSTVGSTVGATEKGAKAQVDDTEADASPSTTAIPDAAATSGMETVTRLQTELLFMQQRIDELESRPVNRSIIGSRVDAGEFVDPPQVFPPTNTTALSVHSQHESPRQHPNDRESDRGSVHGSVHGSGRPSAHSTSEREHNRESDRREDRHEEVVPLVSLVVLTDAIKSAMGIDESRASVPHRCVFLNDVSIVPCPHSEPRLTQTP